MSMFAHKQTPLPQSKATSFVVPGLRSVLSSQRTAGNQLPRRFQTNVDRKEDSPATTLSGHNYDFNRIPVHPKTSNSHDIYEREADRIADRVVRMPGSPLQRTCTCGGKCPKCQAKNSEQVHNRLHTGRGGTGGFSTKQVTQNEPVTTRPIREIAAGTRPHTGLSRSSHYGDGSVPARQADHSSLNVTPLSVPSPAIPATVAHVVSSSGSPLDRSTRDFMESRFAVNLSDVRVHTDSTAARSARAVGAQAYTVGHHIVFDQDFFKPQTITGRHLLAHELVHVLQQRPELVEGTLSGLVSGNTALQRAVHPALLAALAVLAAVVACGLPYHQYALRTYGHKTDKWRHCWVSCQMSKTCGPALTELAGLGKEVRDRAVAAYCDYYPGSSICRGGHGDFWDSLGDLAANQVCIPWETFFVGPIARLWRQSCKDCCDASGL
jgi:hypothetical protein